MQRRGVLTVLMIVVGLTLMIYGQFFMPRPGAYLYVADEPTSQGEITSETVVVDYDELSPSVQRKFEQRLTGETTYLGPEHEAERAFPGELGEIKYVHYQGDYYEIGVTLRHPATIPRALVIPTGGIVTAIGVVGLGLFRMHDG